MSELYEVILKQRDTAGSVNTVNRWNYQMSGTPAAVTGSFGLAFAFGGIESGGLYSSVVEAIRFCQSSSIVGVELIVQNVFNMDDFYVAPFSAVPMTGEFVEPSAAPTTALGFKATRTSRAVRHSQKRVFGMPNNKDVGGGHIDAAYMAANVQPLADAMSATLQYDDEGNILSYLPVTVCKEKYTTPSGNTAYRYYSTYNEQEPMIFPHGAYVPYPTTRTQNSRQYGRGQ